MAVILKMHVLPIRIEGIYAFFFIIIAPLAKILMDAFHAREEEKWNYIIDVCFYDQTEWNEVFRVSELPRIPERLPDVTGIRHLS